VTQVLPFVPPLASEIRFDGCARPPLAVAQAALTSEIDNEFDDSAEEDS
jgi:hypothetical protein